jgi:tetratricopeptide (TPR) repeat protein
MAIADRYGLPVSTSSSVAAQRYQEGMDRQLSYGPEADERFAASIAADEDFALPHAGTALQALFRGDGAAARAAIGRARELASNATRRERQHVEALSVLVAGDTARALALVDEHVADFPRDALLVNQASSTIGFAGRPDREAFRMAFLERLATAYGEDWWFQSALAFTYHEVGRYAESRRLSERSLAQYPGNAHASHNIAHVCFETLDNDGGAAFLADWLTGYDRRAPFHCHLAWHLSLFELHRGNDRRALEICERDVLASPNGRLALIDGAALLWRLMLDDGADGAQRWRPMAELAARSPRPGFIFGDVHAALAYAASGDSAALSALIDGLRALAAKGHATAALAVLLVQAAAAFGAGDLAATLDHLEPVEGEIHRLGGSHAQWELFEETMAVCYLRLGRHEQAKRLLRRRLAHRRSARDLAWLRSAEEAAQRA